MEKQMGLKECAAHDNANGARYRLTGWGTICKERQVKGISRKAVREKKRNAKTEADRQEELNKERNS